MKYHNAFVAIAMLIVCIIWISLLVHTVNQDARADERKKMRQEIKLEVVREMNKELRSRFYQYSSERY